LEAVALQFREVAGALLFLNAEVGQQALKNAADVLQQKFENSTALNNDEVNLALYPLASADMLIDNLKNKQPVLHSMFEVALAHSEKLKTVA
jgi:hypothetical protein